MSIPEWFRSPVWNEAVSTAFEDKLRRARRKEQYLRIQASTLAERDPETAHLLLDRYFKMPDQFDAAQAHVDRARAYLAQNRLGEAIVAFERALAREAEFPKLLTHAFIELPFLVATHRVREHYVRALELLSQHRDRLMFPVDIFMWNAARALVARELGEQSFEFARAALEAAGASQSGFRHHPKVGLVGASLQEVEIQMRRLCAV
jgi:tetratricopeptide (TPR) repeat protein